MRRPLYVHIGLPKTATTTLQRGLFAHHPEIEYLGKRAGREVGRAFRRCLNEAAFRLADRLFWDHVEDKDIEEARRIWFADLLPSLQPEKTPVFSFEGLAVAPLSVRAAIARNLRAFTPGCRVLVGLRQPMELVEAVYFQRLKRRHIGRDSNPFERSPQPSAEEWLESVVAGRELAAHLDYARTIRIFVDALGRDNVGVFALESLRENPARFAEDLCEWMGIDKEAGARLLRGRRHNIRLSQELGDRMLEMERPGIVSAIYARSGRAVRKRMLRMKRFEGGPPARLSILPSIRTTLEERTREGNRWIAEAFNLQLGDYGYPV